MTGTAAIRARLLARLDAAQVEDGIDPGATAPVVLEQDAVGRLSRMDALQQQAMALAAAGRRRLRRDMIRTALARLDAGDYGWCIRCGEPIAPARLEADPATPFCRDCAA